MIALLVEKMKKANLFDDVNIVITGLHGFVEISADKVFDISQFIGSGNSQSEAFIYQPMRSQHWWTNEKSALIY